MKTLLIRVLVAVAIGTLPAQAFAQTLNDEYVATWRAKVVAVVSHDYKPAVGITSDAMYQTLEARLLDGPRKGETVQVANDYLSLTAGDTFYLTYTKDIDGTEYYTVLNKDRRMAMYTLLAVFVVVVVAFGGWQGVRSLLALAGSFLAIFYMLLPGLLAGWDPVLTSSLVASGILFVAIFFTHGFNRVALIAYTGTVLTVLMTTLIALLAVHGTALSGFAEDESVYLNMNTGGTLDFVGLLLGAIIIGVLGVLDDIAITQVAVVADIYTHNTTETRRGAFMRATKIGREHVSALVNTLVLAYTGAALPLLLYVYLAPVGVNMAMNLEVFATEIVRTVVGSIGLILTVPVVTLLAVVFLRGHSDHVPESLSHQH